MQVLDAAQAKKGQEHWLCMQLKPDASRAYKLDNKIKTGKEVKVSFWIPAHTYRPCASACRGTTHTNALRWCPALYD